MTRSVLFERNKGSVMTDQKLTIIPRPRPGLSQEVAHSDAQTPAPATNSYPALRATPVALPPTDTANIAKAIATVQASIGTVQKGGYNAFHQYHYVRMEDMLKILTPLMGKNGLAIIPNEVEVKMVEGNRVAVTYEFSILHESGERWPERPRFTGMAMARDRKGNFDDKAINKCSTAARKYFLSSLFNVPTDDMDDADEGEYPQKPQRTTQAESRRVPGPGPGPGPQQAEPQQAPAQQAPAQPSGPHKIVLGRNAGVAEWKNAYLDAIATAKTREEVLSYDTLNDTTLQRIHLEYPDVMAQIMAAVDKHIDKIETPTPQPAAPAVDTSFGMPKPRENPQAAMAWIAEKLGEFKHYVAAENFWNQVVATRESEFTIPDWANLMFEWRATEARLTTTENDD
jgi:hypothetical protein